jgi:hypothetical protein
MSAKGAGLRFEPNGLAALQAISAELHARVTDVSCTAARMVVFNMEGRLAMSTSPHFILQSCCLMVDTATCPLMPHYDVNECV